MTVAVEQFGKYNLVRKLGEGTMAELFLARTTIAPGLDRTLVIKRIRPEISSKREFTSMFQNEAKITLALNHPHICQVFDFGVSGSAYYLAMEYVEGVDLLRLMQEAAKARRRLPYLVSAYIVSRVAKALDYAHRKTDEHGVPLAIVHRDVSLGNVLLSWDGAIKLADFGLARATDIAEKLGVIHGRFSYMSPEQARGDRVDARSDVFAAGIVLFELVCARPLFGRGRDALPAIKSGFIPRPRDFAPDLPDSLERVILKALAFHREDRYQSARELYGELGSFIADWAEKSRTEINSASFAVWMYQLVFPDTPAPIALDPPAPSPNVAPTIEPAATVAPLIGPAPTVAASAKPPSSMACTPEPVPMVAATSKLPTIEPAATVAPSPKASRPPTIDPANAAVSLEMGLARAIALLDRKLGAPSPQQAEALRALRAQLATGTVEEQVRAQCALAQFHVQLGKPAEAHRALSPALEFTGEAWLEADVMRLQAAIARLLGEYSDALSLVDRALERFETIPSSGPALQARATMLGERGSIFAATGLPDMAVEAFAEALVLFRATVCPRDEARMLNCMAMAFVALGEDAEAVAHYTQALELDRSLG